jgi:D-tyrosyl-tRNA(Tyr) deacylase
LVLLGVTHTDGDAAVTWMARKIWELRIMRGEKSASEVDAPILVVSQFTLYGDARKGRRPSFIRGARGPAAQAEYEAAIAALEDLGVRCESGRFGAMMDVSLVNAGPVTILLDSDKTF